MKKYKFILGVFCSILTLTSCGVLPGTTNSQISSTNSQISTTNSEISSISVASNTVSVCSGQTCTGSLQYGDKAAMPAMTQSGNYESKVDVANYIRQYHKLPSNYITETQRDDGNYDNNNYNVGGMRFGNYEGYLPATSSYIECDIASKLNNRGAYRIVYSTATWKIFYTGDHYSNFQEYLGYNSWGSSFGESSGAYVAPCNPCNSYVF